MIKQNLFEVFFRRLWSTVGDLFKRFVDRCKDYNTSELVYIASKGYAVKGDILNVLTRIICSSSVESLNDIRVFVDEGSQLRSVLALSDQLVDLVATTLSVIALQ